MRLKDKVGIVTGASSGIGLATAKKFLTEGASVVLVARNAKKLEAAAAEANASNNPWSHVVPALAGSPKTPNVPFAKNPSPEVVPAHEHATPHVVPPSGGSFPPSLSPATAIANPGDVSSEADVIRIVDQTLQRFGRLDIIVNNAGVMIFKPLEQQTRDDWRSVLEVDLLGAFYFTKQAFLKMNPANGGAIVNVASIHAVETTPLVSAYAAAKAALLSLTRSSALEGAAKKIRVNAILPGAIDTPMLWENPNVKSGLEQIDRGMTGKPEDIANVAAFLASEEAAFIQGASIIVDGGRLGKL